MSGIRLGLESSITENSVDHETNEAASDLDQLSMIDRYDLKASEFRQYFP